MKSTTRRIAAGSKWSLLAIFALLACALVLAACGGGGSTTDGSEEATSSQEESAGSEETASSEESGAEESEAKGEPIVTMTYTDVNTEGPQYKNIEETEHVYQEWVNSHGGIGGRQ